jgi:hypothetical protein
MKDKQENKKSLFEFCDDHGFGWQSEGSGIRYDQDILIWSDDNKEISLYFDGDVYSYTDDDCQTTEFNYNDLKDVKDLQEFILKNLI